MIQVAVVDDHTLVTEGFTSLLHAMGGFRVSIAANSGIDLLDKVAKATSLPDVCLLDINMPEMDGFETMLRLNTKWPEIKCVALTLHSEDEVILRMLRNGARGYLSKSCTAAVLKEAITEVHANEYYFSGLVLKKFPKISGKNIKEYIKKALGEKQIEFLALCCTDLTYEEIAEKMNISHRTAQNYAYKLCDKLNVHSRIGLAMYALHIGIGKFKSN